VLIPTGKMQKEQEENTRRVGKEYQEEKKKFRARIYENSRPF
jgi:hypothetical protein